VEEVSLCFELGRGTVIVREDQLSLAIGRRGQNVRLAARLTGWDLDILTPAEFANSLETLEKTIRPLEGITDEMLDRMGALGMISVFDVEEVGPAVLVEELSMSQELAEQVIEVCGEQAKIVAEQQQREKEEAERRRAEEEAAGAALLASAEEPPEERGVHTDADAEAAAASILGDFQSDSADTESGQTVEPEPAGEPDEDEEASRSASAKAESDPAST
jgi:N utilization substance protein A